MSQAKNFRLCFSANLGFLKAFPHNQENHVLNKNMTTKIRFSFFSIVFLTLILLLSWTKIGQEESEPKFNLRILPDDLKIVDFDSESGEKWTLGEIRRSPLKQKFHNVSVENLPKLMDFKIYNSDLIGTINRTKNEASVLFYNRVPKTASSTMQNLLCLQSDSLNFSFVKSDFYWQRANSVKSEIELILLLKNLTQYTIYDQHSYFINIKR